MSDEQKWIKELSDFFAKDKNWSIACETVSAVEKVEAYWISLFWDHVYQQCREVLDENLWEVRKENEEVDIYLKYDKYKVEESCYIIITCDEEDGCWYGIWREKDDYTPAQNKNIEQFSESQGLIVCDETLYRSQVTPYLDKAQLGKEIKNNFESANKLVKETADFIQNSKVREMILGLSEK